MLKEIANHALKSLIVLGFLSLPVVHLSAHPPAIHILYIPVPTGFSIFHRLNIKILIAGVEGAFESDQSESSHGGGWAKSCQDESPPRQLRWSGVKWRKPQHPPGAASKGAVLVSGLVAQWREHRNSNPAVPGPSPGEVTNSFLKGRGRHSVGVRFPTCGPLGCKSPLLHSFNTSSLQTVAPCATPIAYESRTLRQKVLTARVTWHRISHGTESVHSSHHTPPAHTLR